MKFKEFIKSPHSKTPHYLLIGYPIGHSVSPIMHDTALEHHQIDANYIAVSIELSELADAFTHFNTPEFLGANITIPYKENMIPFMDELTVIAKEIGAVNTVIKTDGKLIGDNTDAYGFSIPLNEIEENLKKERAIVFGTGGATKAILYALKEFGFNEICMVTRRKELFVAEQELIFCSYDEWQHYSEKTNLFVNATPLGMAPNVESSPILDNEIDHLSGKVCYDIVYNPRETKFLKQAKKADAKAIGGIDMLIHQGDKSFYRWTSKRFPLSLIKMKLDEHFSI